MANHDEKIFTQIELEKALLDLATYYEMVSNLAEVEDFDLWVKNNVKQ